MMAEKLYTSRQVAEILQVHQRTVLIWLRTGKLHGVKMGRLWRIPESELNRISGAYGEERPCQQHNAKPGTF
jgi:acetyl-CoA synthetase